MKNLFIPIKFTVQRYEQIVFPLKLLQCHLEQLHILKMYQNLLYWLINSWGWSSSFSWQHIANINLNTRLRLLYYVCFKSWIYKIISTRHFRLFKYLFQNRDFIDWHSFSVHNIPKEIFINYIDGTLFKTSHKNL